MDFEKLLARKTCNEIAIILKNWEHRLYYVHKKYGADNIDDEDPDQTVYYANKKAEGVARKLEDRLKGVYDFCGKHMEAIEATRETD